MSDQNEGLYDSVSTPADQPVQTSGVPSRAGASGLDSCHFWRWVGVCGCFAWSGRSWVVCFTR